jgi:hypothetical protein
MNYLRIIIFAGCMTICCFFFYGCGGGGADGDSDSAGTSETDPKPADEISAPNWQIGDSWVIESEIVNAARVMAGAEPPEVERQKWLFEVADIKCSEKQEYFLLDIKAGDKNNCPYAFTFWVRNPDLYIYSYKIMYAGETKAADGSGDSYRKFITGNNGENYIDYFLSRFPTLPLILAPKFESEEWELATAKSDIYHRPARRLLQRVAVIKGSPPATTMERSLKRQMGHPFTTDEYTEVTLELGKIQEVQYWQEGLPWPFYGQRSSGGTIEKRFWLCEVKQ